MRCNKCGQFLSSSGKCDHCAQNNKKNTIMLLSLVFLVIGVFAGSMVVIKLRISKTNIVYNRAIDSATEIFNLSLFSLNEDVNYTFDVNSSFELFDNNYLDDTMLFQIFSDLSSIITTEFNNEKELMNITVDSLYSNEELINIDFSLSNKEAYLLIDEYESYIKLPISESTYNTLFNRDDFYELFIQIGEEIKNSFDDKYFSREIYIEDKSQVNEYILNLKGNNLKNFNSNLLNNLKKNNKFITLLSKLSGYSEEHLINFFEETINLNKVSEYNEDNGIIFHIYTKGEQEEFFSILVEYQIESIIKELLVFINEDETLFFEYIVKEEIKEVVIKDNSEEIDDEIEEVVVEESELDSNELVGDINDLETQEEIEEEIEYIVEVIEIKNLNGLITIYNNQIQHKANINILSDIFEYQLNINRKSAKTNVSATKIDSYIESDEFSINTIEEVLNKLNSKSSIVKLKEKINFFNFEKNN